MSEALPWVAKGIEWANDVLEGRRPACIYVKQSCERFANDLQRKKWDYEFDADEAERWLEFLASLKHVKGRRFAGKPFEPAGWQCFCTMNLYGWVHKETRLRRFTNGYVECPRKNGKSFWFGGLGLGHLCIDDEPGAEVYTGATSEKQAWEVFRPARQICLRSDMAWLLNTFGIEVNAKSLTIPMEGSRFEPLIGNPGDGAGPSCAIADEFHEHKTSDLVDTMADGMGARDQAMMLEITTAGTDFGGPCREKHNDVVNILKGSEDDDAVFGIIFTIDEDDDWDSEEALIKANPNWDVMNHRYLLTKLKQARRSASKQNSYKTKHLNLWVGAKVSWMNMLAYQACRRKTLRLSKFKGLHCFGGLDLATKKDIADLALLFPPQAGNRVWTGFCRHYLPEDTVENGNQRYRGWFNDGWLVATPGNVTDFRYIADDLDEYKSMFQINRLGYDPFQAVQFATEREDEGFDMVEYGQTVKNFSQPMKELEALILQKQLRLQFDPVLLWMFGNVVARLDKKDNIFPNKEREENKIDGVVALIMALALALSEIEEGDSIYEKTAL